jgi:hypothetical protein
MNKPIRHGEVILKPVIKVPKGKLQTVDTYTLADSDAGHHHVLNSKQMDVTTAKDKVYLSIVEPGTIVHQKQTDRHKDLPVAAGFYQVLKKNEYNPFEKIIQEVKD